MKNNLVISLLLTFGFINGINNLVYQHCVTYIELITMTNTLPYDYHDIVISWKKGSSPTAETQPSKYNACISDVTVGESTLTESDSSSIYKNYVPRESGIPRQSTVKGYTVYWDIVPTCLPDNTIRVSAKMMFFSCSAGSRIFYDSILSSGTYINKVVIDHPNGIFSDINSDVKTDPVGFNLSTNKIEIRDFVRYNANKVILDSC